jgi:lysozyme family protein
MAKVELYFPKVLRYEGGFVNDPTDRGGPTNMGVTLSTWRAIGHDIDGDSDIDANDIRLLTKDDAMMVMKVGYWDRWRADSIKNQSVAESLVEWVWGSGKWGVVIPQRLLGVTEDGIVGMQTISALNAANQKWFHEKLRLAKLQFIADLIKRDPRQEKFKNGWVRRINEYSFSE